MYLHFWLQLQLQFHASGCTLRRAPMRMRRVHFKAAHLGRERVRVRVYSVYAYCKFQSPRSHSAACHKICHEQAILCAQENECAAQIRNFEFSNLQLPYSSHTLSRSLQAILYCSLFYCFLFISNLTVFFCRIRISSFDFQNETQKETYCTLDSSTNSAASQFHRLPIDVISDSEIRAFDLKAITCKSNERAADF